MEQKIKNSNHGIMFTDKDGYLWFTFSKPWWALSEWLWYWLCPGQKTLITLKRLGSSKQENMRMVSFGKVLAEIK